MQCAQFLHPALDSKTTVCLRSVLLSHCLFFSPPELLFNLSGKGIENRLLDDQAAALQQFTLSQLHRQTLQPVPPELQLRQVDQLTETRGQRLQVVIAQVQSAQLLTLEQLRRKLLNLRARQKGEETNKQLNSYRQHTETNK